MRMRKSEKFPEAIKKFVVATDGTYLGRVKERSSQEYREKDAELNRELAKEYARF
ncbi:MAG TPA: hypothetical protein VJB11_04170 [archaeon]|nr:hypothetical protein [archaeon]